MHILVIWIIQQALVKVGVEVSGQKNKQGKFSGYKSDGHSAASEVVRMQIYQRGFLRSQSLRLASGGKNELHKTEQPHSRSWEGIMTDLHLQNIMGSR